WTTHNHQGGVGKPRRYPVEGSQGYVDALQRLHPPHEGDYRTATQSQRMAGGILGAGSEPEMIHPRWGDTQRLGTGSVVGEKVVGLERSRSDHTVRAGDHFLLGGDAKQRLGRVVMTLGQVLD